MFSVPLLLFVLTDIQIPTDTRPLPEDRFRLPSAEVCNSNLELNWAFGVWLESMDPGNNDRWREAIKENNRLREIWQHIYSLQCLTQEARDDGAGDEEGENWLREERRERLDVLRIMLGDDNYYAGKIPNCVPQRYLQVIR
jgi:hypothetical protein